MGARELFSSGNLQAAINQLLQDVKSKPLDMHSRIFLFELLCFCGDFERAERQLDAIAQTSGDVKIEMGALVYRSVLQAEKSRKAFFTGAQRAPKFFSSLPITRRCAWKRSACFERKNSRKWKLFCGRARWPANL